MNLFDRRRLGDRRQFGAVQMGNQMGKKSARAKNALRTGEIVGFEYRIAVVLNCPPGLGRGRFHRLMSSFENDDGEFRPDIFFVEKESKLIVRLSDVIPDKKLEQSACNLHALLTTTDAGFVTKSFVDLPVFEAALTRWYEILRTVQPGALDAARKLFDGSAASNRLLDLFEGELEKAA
jgi:hypothetical protein